MADIDYFNSYKLTISTPIYLIVVFNNLLSKGGVLLERPGQLDHVLSHLLLHLLVPLKHFVKIALKAEGREGGRERERERERRKEGEK